MPAGPELGLSIFADFSRALLGAGGEARLLLERKDLVGLLGEIVQSEGVQRACVDRSPLLTALEIREVLASLGVETRGPEGGRAWVAGADLGVTSALAGVAETGSVILVASEDSPQELSLLPPIHLALLHLGDIEPDLDSGLARLAMEGPPRRAVLVTGPSRTADVEQTLVVGVHGPRRLVVGVWNGQERGTRRMPRLREATRVGSRTESEVREETPGTTGTWGSRSLPRDVLLLPTCLVLSASPELVHDALGCLRAARARVRIIPSPVCCGQAFYNAGLPEEARNLARRLAETAGEGTVVIPSGSCTQFVRARYGELLGSSRSGGPGFQALELGEYLARAGLPEPPRGATPGLRLALHTSCHATHLGPDPWREVLERLPGLELVAEEPPEACCGFGGVFSLLFPSTAARLGERRCRAAEAAGAELITGGDLGCLLHISRSTGLPVVHAATLARSILTGSWRGAGLRSVGGEGTGRAWKALARTLPRLGRWRFEKEAALVPALTREAILAATDRLVAARREAWKGLEGILREAARIRQDSARSLPHLAEAAAARLEASGARVHRARHSLEATSLVVALARQRKVRRVVKSKSMLAEEVGLREALERAGVGVVETDLGEWIVQLAGEKPAHIIAPALHKTRFQVAELVAAETGKETPGEIPAITARAREHLRGVFLKADMGLTGANFLVASTGTLVLVTNEGNGRMVTSLPDLQVSLVGVERVVPDWKELAPLLRALVASATGQPLTSYVSFITGPAASPAEGARELHVVLVDGGRSGLLGTAYEPILWCIRCGACLNVCPVYRQAGGSPYRSPYPGPVGILLSSLLGLGENPGELPYASTLCGACEEACPVGIPLAELIARARAENPPRRPRPRSSTERLLHLGMKVLARAWSVRGADRLAVLATGALLGWRVRIGLSRRP